jgi:hypothetical protein
MDRTDKGSDLRINAKLRTQVNEGSYVKLIPRELDATPDNVPFAGEDEEWKLRECRLEKES